MQSDLERFTARLIAVLRGKDPAGVHTPITIGDLRQVIMPYRQNRAALGLTSAEDYDLLVLRLISEEEGLVRTFPADVAERAREEVGAANPDLELIDAVAEATIQIGAATAARLAVTAVEAIPPRPEPPRAAPAAGNAAAEPGPPPVADEAEPSRWAGPGNNEALDERPFAGAAAASEEPLPVDLPVFDAIEVPGVAPAGEEPEAIPAPPTRDPGQPLGCPSCAKPLPTHRTVTFCPSCGWQVAARRCRRCGEVVEADWRHCVACGLVADGSSPHA